MPNYRVSLTRISFNEKTGPIPVSTTESSTCPPTCKVRDECYAKTGPLRLHWSKINDGSRGVDWTSFCTQVKALPKNQLWRHNQAGDLPGDGVRIDKSCLNELTVANKGKRGFTYTHYPLSLHNIACIEAANTAGFTVSISCDALYECDKVRDITDVPIAVVLHSDEKRKTLHTPAGAKVIVCPATYKDVQCVTCELCYMQSRAIVGFPAHGTKKKQINKRLEGI